MDKSKKIIPTFNTTIEELKDTNRLDFSNFEQNIEAAIVLWHLNRGILHLNPLCDLNDQRNKKKLKEEIRAEKISDVEKKDLIERFETSQGRFCKILACGSCGIKNLKEETILCFIGKLH